MMISRRFWAALLALPIVLAVLIDDVARFVAASCNYYGSCNPPTFTVTAQPASIALNETSALEAFDAACPCSWQIQSQPGGWQVVAGPDCTATVKPIGSYGSAGPIYVQCTSPGYCSKTVEVTAGVSTFRLQASTDGGNSWTSDSLSIEGKPGETVDFALRVTMTVTNETIEGWQYSVAQDFSAITQESGSLSFLSLPTIVGTHTNEVQLGSPPDYFETDDRQDSFAVTKGFIQGVVVDYQSQIVQNTVLNFVTAGACYRLTLPTAGSYQGVFSFTNDLKDGNVPVASLIVKQGREDFPQLRSLLIDVDSNVAHTTNPGSCASDFTTSGDGLVGPPPSGGGSPGGGGGTPVPPILIADADDNGVVNVTDAVFVLRFLFASSGMAPELVDTTLPIRRILQTNQGRCYDQANPLEACLGFNNGQEFSGQDADYLAGTPRTSYALRDPNEDGTFGVIVDGVTGLMWQRTPESNGTGLTLAQAEAGVTALNTIPAPNPPAPQQDGFEGFTDWRLPTVTELHSVFDYSRIAINGPTTLNVAVPDIFDWGEVPGFDTSVAVLWTSTDYPFRVDADGDGTPDSFQWVVSTVAGNVVATQDSDSDAGFVAVRGKRIPDGFPVGVILPRNQVFQLGDFDLNGTLNLTDPVAILNYLFRPGSPPSPAHTTQVVPLEYGVGRFGPGPSPFTIVDTQTELEWVNQPLEYSDNMPTPCSIPDGLVDWKDALFDAEGHVDTPTNTEDWRLPNIFELGSLTDYRKTSTPATDPLFAIFSNEACFICDVNTGCAHPFWSSTSVSNDTLIGQPERAYQFFPNTANDPGSPGSFANGGIHARDQWGRKETQDNSTKGYSLPVRGGGTAQ